MGDARADVERELEGLRREIAELAASRRRIVLATDAERRDLERALHDGVQQRLVALATTLELAAVTVEADPAAPMRIFEEIGRDALEILEETRTLAHRIYPPLLESGGLVAALRTVAAQRHVRTSIDVEPGGTYPLEIAGAVYFCCLDVFDRLSAGASTAVSVRRDDSTLAFEIVADNVSDAEELLLRDRVDALGGRVSITTGAGRRLSVTGFLPVSG